MWKREVSPPPLLPYKKSLVRGDAAQPVLLPPQKSLRRSRSSPASLCSEPITLSLPSPSALLRLFPSPSPFFFFFFWLRLKDLTGLERRKSLQSVSTLSIINKGLGKVAHCYWLKHFGKVIFKVWAFPFPLQAHLGPLRRNFWSLLYFILGPMALLRSNRQGGEGGGGMGGAEGKMKTGGGEREVIERLQSRTKTHPDVNNC